MHLLSSIAAVIVLSDIGLASLALYLLPLLIGWMRRVPDIGSIAAVNLLLGWTLIGWAAALALALRSQRLPAPAPAVQIVQNLPGLPPTPVPSATLSWAGRPDPRPHREGCPPPLELPPRPAGPQGGHSGAPAPAETRPATASPPATPHRPQPGQ